MHGDVELLAKGALLGFSVSAPIGPVGILCIRRTLAHGAPGGIAVGLGAATADVMYATLAATGLTALSSTLVAYQALLRVVAALFLFWIAARALLAKPELTPEPITAGRILAGYSSGLLLLITNPVSILLFAAVFAGLGLSATEPDPTGAASIVVGVFVGTQLWWVVLSAAVDAVRTRVNATVLRRINLGSALLLVGLGVGIVARL